MNSELLYLRPNVLVEPQLRAACQAGGVSVRIGVQWLSAPRIDSGIGISPRANEWTCLP